MTQEEIIEMARQAGVEDSNEYNHLVCTEVELVAFAKLVAAKERDRLYREKRFVEILGSFSKLVAAKAAEKEREACAKMCEEYFERVMASRIRTRGQE